MSLAALPNFTQSITTAVASEGFSIFFEGIHRNSKLLAKRKKIVHLQTFCIEEQSFYILWLSPHNFVS